MTTIFIQNSIPVSRYFYLGFIIFITASFSAAGYIVNGMGHPGLPEWSFGFVDLQRGVALAIGSLFLARSGAYVSFRTHPFRLRKLFALFLIIVSTYILMK